MVRLALPEHGRPGAGTPLTLGIGGAESNVAIAVARLGALVCGARGDWEGLLDWDGHDPERPSTDVVR